MKSTIKFEGWLRKGNIEYYFEIEEKAVFMPEENVYMPEYIAYIEKTDWSKADPTEETECGEFTVEKARRCWKALKAKGYREA